MSELINGKEMDKKVEFVELGDAAIGGIEAGELSQERLEELTERVGTGEFHVATDGKLPGGCVDGRPGGALRPNAAGGSETIFVADDLTSKSLASSDGSTAGGYANTLRALTERGYEVGGHTDDHAHGEASGCGANDKLASIYEYIATRGDVLRATTAHLGIQVSDETHEMITGNAAARTEFSHGAELLSILREQAGEGAVDPLEGAHQEVLAVINNRPGTTLDRVALADEFGLDYEVFNVDAWTFSEAANAVAINPEDAGQKVVAMVYYNLATTYVLSGPKMRVVVLN